MKYLINSCLFILFWLSITATYAQKNELENYKSQIEKYQQEGDKVRAAQFMNKVAQIYWDSDNYNEAIDYFKQSLAINVQLGNNNAISQISNNLGMLYTDVKQYDNSISCFEKSLSTERLMKRKDKIVDATINIASVLNDARKYKEANKRLEDALSIAQTLEQGIPTYSRLRRIYGQLAENYKRLGDSENAIKYTNLYTTFDNYVKNKHVEEVEKESQQKVGIADAAKKATEKELNKTSDELKKTDSSLTITKAISQKRQLEIDMLSKQKEIDQLKLSEKDAKLKTERTIRNFVGAFCILIVLFFILILKQFRDKKKAYERVSEQNVILNQQKQEIEKQSTLLTASYKELEKKNKQITDSILYARKIQEAILPSKLAIKKALPDSFIFYRPRDIVSGDFYWFSQKEDYAFIAAVDCTGHSVPGAFMSMIGNTLLNEIVNDKKIYDTSEILLRLNAGVIYALQQNVDTDDSQDDGMDLTLCRIDRKNKEINIACANHFCYAVRDGKLEVIEGDPYSIGGSLSTRPNVSFTTHTIPIETQTTIYMFSDGYLDQFGGDDNKKFTERRMRELLSTNYQLDMPKQLDLLEANFIEWVGKRSQLDDILVMGIRIDV